jgi:tRNA threonylcarbamoyladenosine biosynthesis protein TsaB
MNNLLAIETSEEACSAALLSGDGSRELFEIEPRKHSELILPMIDRLLAEAGVPRGSLDAVAFGRGPGSFTGVRIATAVAQGIGYGLDIPVVPVSTLQALAQGVWRQQQSTHVLAALDARMSEVYWGAYTCEEGLMRPVDEELVIAPSQVPVPEAGGWTAVGSGWSSYAEALGGRIGERLAGIFPDAACHALDVATVASRMLSSAEDYSVFDALPVYLRNQVTHRK